MSWISQGLPISERNRGCPPATMAAKEAAEAGRANYKNGDYKAAALCFTEALEDIDAEDTHKLYSNRSACRMHLQDFKGAKEDAESCTALKPSWAKGWARLGAAQGRLGEISEAVASYEKAHELDPTEGEYEREAAKLATPPPRRRRRPSTTVAMAPEPFGALDAPHLLVRVACLAGVVVYATSFTTDASVLRLKYKSAVRWAVLSALLHAYRAHGVPKLSADYARRLFTDPHAQRLFGGLILLVGSGSLFGLIPVADAELAALLAQFGTRLRRNVKTRPLSLKLIAKCEGAVLDGSGRVAGAVLRRCSLFEVTAALVLLLELATPRRNPILLLLYWRTADAVPARARAGGRGGGAAHEASSRSTRGLWWSWRASPPGEGRARLTAAGAPGRPAQKGASPGRVAPSADVRLTPQCHDHRAVQAPGPVHRASPSIQRKPERREADGGTWLPSVAR